MIGIALSCRPKLLIADEPTTALDVTIQAQVLDLIGDLRRELGMSVVLITHDLGVVAEHTDRVAVMYAGQIVETGPTQQLIEQPRHPYTRGLIGLIPKLSDLDAPIRPIEGRVPELIDLGGVCRFYERCEFRQPTCQSDIPMNVIAPDRQARCLRGDEIPRLKEVSQ
jgi:oligopeptide/dipeptide ABC transporter ATP-binding protein